MPWLNSEFDPLRGQPTEMRRTAVMARSMAEQLTSSARSAVAAGAVDRSSWDGQAADRWAERIIELPARLERGAEHLAAAAAALDRFADHLDDAQTRVANARFHVAALPHDPPDDDADAERDRWMQRARAARRDGETANGDARRAFDAIAAGAQFAPRGNGGGLLGHLGRAVGSATDAVGGQMISFGQGVYDGTVGTVVAITALGADAAQFAVAHPDEVLAGARHVITHPDQVLGAVWDNKGDLLAAAVNLDTLTSDPARWLGQLAPTVLLAATGGGAAARIQQAARESKSIGPVVRGAQLLTGLQVAAEAPATTATAAWTVAGNLARSESRNTELIRTALEPTASAPASPSADPPILPCPEPSADPDAAEPAVP